MASSDSSAQNRSPRSLPVTLAAQEKARLKNAPRNPLRLEEMTLNEIEDKKLTDFQVLLKQLCQLCVQLCDEHDRQMVFRLQEGIGGLANSPLERSLYELPVLSEHTPLNDKPHGEHVPLKDQREDNAGPDLFNDKQDEHAPLKEPHEDRRIDKNDENAPLKDQREDSASLYKQDDQLAAAEVQPTPPLNGAGVEPTSPLNGAGPALPQEPSTPLKLGISGTFGKSRSLSRSEAPLGRYQVDGFIASQLEKSGQKKQPRKSHFGEVPINAERCSSLTAMMRHKLKGKVRQKVTVEETPQGQTRRSSKVVATVDSLHASIKKTLKGSVLKRSGIWQWIARHSYFESTTLAVIAANSIWIGCDTDFNKADLILNAEPVFQVVENLFCLYFLLEWFIRLKAFAKYAFCLTDTWFMFDTFLVTLMVFETWIASTLVLLFQSSTGGRASNMLRMLRLLRLSRMCRMARLVRAFPELIVLVKGMLKSTRSVFTTLSLLVGLMYVFAILFTQMLLGSAIGEERFHGVAQSMYTLWLYGLLCLDYAEEITIGLVEVHFSLAVAYYVFILLAAFNVMNMLIGVLCEVVSQVSATEKEASLLTYTKYKLESVMKTLDEDGNGYISKQEFVQLLDKPETESLLQDLGIDIQSLVDFADIIFDAGLVEVDPEAEAHGQAEVQLSFTDFLDLVLQLRSSRTATMRDIVELRRLMCDLHSNLLESLASRGATLLSLGRSTSLG